MNYEIRYVRGHVEVYDQAGRFRFSADPGGGGGGEREQDPAPKMRANHRAPGLWAGRPL